MPRAITILSDNFSDWETALLNSTARQYYGFYTSFATPGGMQVASSGGMLVTPQLALEDITLDGLDALIVCGGSIWQTRQAPDITALLVAAHARGVLVAGICDGTRVLAQAGLLDHVRHTSNCAENLAQTGYAGAAHYQHLPCAVADGRVVTAPGSAPVSFMNEILRNLDICDDNLASYIAMHAAEHGQIW